MAIAFRAAGTAKQVSSGNLSSVGLPAGTATGDLLIALVGANDNVALAFPDTTPIFKSAGLKSVGTTGAVTVAAPGSIATGDLEILISATISGQTVSVTTDGGSAWTSLGSSTCTSGEDLFVWYRVRQAGDGSPIVTPSGDHSISVRICYTAGSYDPTTPISNWTTSFENTSDTSFSWAPGFSTSVDNSLAVVISTSGVDSNTAQVPVCTNASLSNLASRTNSETTSGLGGGFGYTEGKLATHGAVGTFATTYASASPKAYAAFSINADPLATSWTKIVETNNGASQRMTVAWKIADSAPSAPTITHTGGGPATAQIYGFSGTDTTTPIATTGTVGTGSGSGVPFTITATGFTPAGSGSEIVFLASTVQTAATGGTSGNNYGSWAATDPSSFTEMGDNLNQLGATEVSIGAGYGASGGGATGSGTVVVSLVDSGAHVWEGVLLEIAAPTGGGSTKSITPDAISSTSAVTASATALRAVLPGSVSASSAVTANVAKIGAIKGTINATSAVTGAVAKRAAISPASIASSSAVTASLVVVRAITPASVSSTSNVTATLSRLGTASIVPASINATSAVSSSLVAKRAILPASINSTSTVSASVIKLAQIRASINATSDMAAAVTLSGASTGISNLTSVDPNLSQHVFIGAR
jgi:hypothetical protein